MKMYLGDTAVKGVMLHTDSDDATLKASDLQSGVTAYAKGQKVTGSGKSFEFASYGDISSNIAMPIPVSDINTVIVSAVNYPIRMSKSALELQALDFSVAQEVAIVTVNGTEYPIKIKAASNMITISCGQTIQLQLMFGKDNYT